MLVKLFMSALYKWKCWYQTSHHTSRWDVWQKKHSERAWVLGWGYNLALTIQNSFDPIFSHTDALIPMFRDRNHKAFAKNTNICCILVWLYVYSTAVLYRFRPNKSVFALDTVHWYCVCSRIKINSVLCLFDTRGLTLPCLLIYSAYFTSKAIW